MSYEWIIVILVAIISIVIIIYSYFNTKHKQLLKYVAKKFSHILLTKIVVENKWILIPGNLTNDIKKMQKKIKNPEQLAKVLISRMKMSVVNFLWLFLKKIIEQYTEQTESKRNLLFRDTNYASEQKNNNLFKNSLGDLIQNYQVQLYQLDLKTKQLNLITIEKYYQSLSEFNLIVFVNFQVQISNKTYSFITWPIGEIEIEIEEIYQILNSNKIKFFSSLELVNHYYDQVFNNLEINNLENLETNFSLCQLQWKKKLQLLTETQRKLTFDDKTKQILLSLNLIELATTYETIRKKMLKKINDTLSEEV